MAWLDIIENQNKYFTQRVDFDRISVQRQNCPYAVITCMDPRINLEALGILPFSPGGEPQSQIRIIRTLGAMADDRSLLAGIHLAGFKELAIVMHTDCGCRLAWSKTEVIIANLKARLPKQKLKILENEIGQLDHINLRHWLKAFQDPRRAVKQEIKSIKSKSFVTDDLIVHGIVYCLETGKVDIVVNGYKK